MCLQVHPHETKQVAQHVLVPHVRRWRHVMHSVDQLMPLPIIWKQHEVVVGELHARTGRLYGITPRHCAHCSVVRPAKSVPDLRLEECRMFSMDRMCGIAISAMTASSSRRIICGTRSVAMKYSRRELGLLLPTLVAAAAAVPKTLEAQQAAPAGGADSVEKLPVIKTQRFGF